MSAAEQHTHQFSFIEKVKAKLRPNGILTYCNLTSLGVLFGRYLTKDDIAEKTWETIWNETQKPHLLSVGWKEDEIEGFEVFKLPEVSIKMRGNCLYYSHSTCLVPKLIKKL